MLRVPLSIFLRAAVLSYAVFPRSCTIATCPSFCRMALAFRRMFFVSRVPVACRFNRTLRAIGPPPVCSWTWTIVLSTCCACRICLRTAARFVFPFFTVRRSLACWKLVGNAPRHRSPMMLMYSRSFAITCLSSWSAWHRAFALVVRPSSAARSMSYVMSCLPF